MKQGGQNVDGCGSWIIGVQGSLVVLFCLPHVCSKVLHNKMLVFNSTLKKEIMQNKIF